ncbi:MAG TPA: peroxidase family protein, partial [Candidatus Elarobacter sp.]|nr:peroxidase family protein [Candidatus Elarobacter sp.]
MTTAWRETYQGGSPEAERLAFERMAQDIMGVQLTSQKRAKASAVRRTFHAKPIFATVHASLRVVDELPEHLRAGWVQPGRTYSTIVRFSNASSVPQPDGTPDLRGAALRVGVSADEQHDLLMTNFPVSHARNAHQFVEFAKATAGGPLSKIAGLIGLAFKVGPPETLRMLENIKAGRSRNVRSIALETFWSRGASRWGETLAVRFLLRPADGTAPAPSSPASAANDLAWELVSRLKSGDVRFELCVQPFVDETSTPIEDTAVEWTERISPPIPVAVLTIQKQVVGAAARGDAQAIESLSFNPWNTTDEFRPLGNLNRARKNVYDASSAHRLSQRWVTPTPLRNVLFGAVSRGVFHAVNAVVEWHRLPPKVGLLNLDAFRHVLRRDNLIDTDIPEAPPRPRPVPPQVAEDVRLHRTYDGTFNDLSAPKMGSVDAVFGRNLRPVYRPDLFDTPNAVVVTEQLLKRESFIPATIVNILAAAWIQFQVHDWVDHARYALDGEHDVTIPMPPGMTVQNRTGGDAETVMRLAGNTELEGDIAGAPILFGNNTSHWWDSSEVYGNNFVNNQRLRDDGSAKLRLPGGYLADDVSGQTVTGFNFSWWLGLAGMHTLFAREHNVLCDELRSHYKTWDEERIFQTARLIVSALIAKIHTIEWTPAILATKAID